MGKIFNDSFFRFVLGFIGIIALSFGITFAADHYAEKEAAAAQAAAAQSE